MIDVAWCKWSKVWGSGMSEKDTLRWFGLIEGKKSLEFVEKGYVSEIDGTRRRGRLVVRWKDRVKEYMH